MVIPTVTSVSYHKTHPNLEHAASVLLETGISLSAAGKIGEKASIAAFGALEVGKFRDLTQNIVRELTADKTIHYSDGSKRAVSHQGLTQTATAISPQGNPNHETKIMGSTVIERQFDEGGESKSSTFHVFEGGSFSFDRNGKYTGNKCSIM